jgi:hypothetical protein
MPRIPSISNPLRGRGTKMRGAGRKAFKVPTTKAPKKITVTRSIKQEP